jgi:bifunctional UDP-N-acetylglucosamine pyrophosphorylase/glucosamine-1-phosphate N-acetyltransferase
VNPVEQVEQKGTGHAVAQVLPHIDPDNNVLILYGDVPLIEIETLQRLIDKASSGFALLTVDLPNPQGYGRIVRDTDNNVKAIVEHKDASEEQLTITEVNTGVMCVRGDFLARWLPELSSNNSQGEYYLTDIVAMAEDEEVCIQTEQPAETFEVEGINDRLQLSRLERIHQRKQADYLMANGITLMDPTRFDLRGTLNAGTDIVIDINTVLEGEVNLGSNVKIGPNCVIRNASIGDGVEILANSLIEDSLIESDCVIGPYARLRPGTELKSKAKVGNFVEIKKSTVGVGSKINHLSYIGDTIVGENANIGAGTITCNYDGVNKFQTEIGDGAFIGSNSSLIAPVKIGKNATTGAGSAINKDIPDENLGVARAKQRNIDTWQRPSKKS